MKKVISLILCAVLAFSCCVTGFAKTGEEYPLVIVEGIQIDKSYLDFGTENQRTTLEAISIPNIVFGIVKGIVFSCVFHNPQLFTDELCKTAKEALKYFSCDKNGNSVFDIQTEKYPLAISNYETYPTGDIYEPGLLTAAIDRYGAQNCYYYRYDWRLDPLDNADEINALVETAKKDHGCDKVNLLSASMGGVNALCYLSKYGSDSVNNCIFLSSTLFGTYVASDLLQGKVDFNDFAVYEYLGDIIGDMPAVGTLLSLLYRTGTLKLLCGFLNRYVENNSRQLYDEVMRDAFATMPALWAVTRPEEYEDCLNFIFYTDELKAEYAGVISRAEALQEVMRNRENILNKAMENGMHLSIAASYNLPLIPVYERAVVQGDSILETAPMLGNATVAEFGKTLGDGYKAADPKLVSPDNVVDMSTAVYPEYTWVIKDAIHVPCHLGSDINNFLFALIEADTQPTVTTLEGYSQFMRVDENYNFINF